MCADTKVSAANHKPEKGCVCGMFAIVDLRFHCAASINARMSETFHALILGPNLTGRGYLPALIPAHQLDLLTGKNLRTVGRRRKPVSGRTLCVAISILVLKLIMSSYPQLFKA